MSTPVSASPFQFPTFPTRIPSRETTNPFLCIPEVVALLESRIRDLIDQASILTQASRMLRPSNERLPMEQKAWEDKIGLQAWKTSFEDLWIKGCGLCLVDEKGDTYFVKIEI